MLKYSNAIESAGVSDEAFETLRIMIDHIFMSESNNELIRYIDNRGISVKDISQERDDLMDLINEILTSETADGLMEFLIIEVRHIRRFGRRLSPTT